MATIRQHRRTRLAEKLQEVFDLPDIREVLAGKLLSPSLTPVPLSHLYPRNALLATAISP